MDTRLLLAATAASVTLAAAAPSLAAGTFSLSFSPSKAGQSTALHVAGMTGGTQLIDQLTTVLPTGTKVDTSAVPRCTAPATAPSGADGGYAASCAATTKVGKGTGRATINGTATTFGLVFFNSAKGMLVDITLAGKVAFTTTYRPSGSRIVFDLSLAPKIKAKVTGYDFTIAKHGTGGKAYIRTPKTCPSSGRLSASVIARASGASTTTKTTVACKA